MTLRDMYNKHHWQVSGPTSYQLHLLFDKHFGEQTELVDALAEPRDSSSDLTDFAAAARQYSHTR
jgi:DNA-binding ferritin-like protein